MKICEKCKKRGAKVTFCNSVLEYTHGFEQGICRECFIEILKKTIKTAEKTLQEQEKLIEREKQKEIKKQNE